MSRHLIDLLKGLKPRRALFTTFTANVAFFDAAVFPALSSGDGCETSVLVDARQFGIASQASFSRDAGMQYTIAPVKAPGGGIFHPKLAFIETVDDQILAVGSGNLTPAGLCGQLESWDVSRRSEHPHLFVELSGFFSELGAKIRETSPRASAILVKAARRADPGSTLPSGPRDIRLVHTLAESAASQLVKAVDEHGHKARRLTVLSPFHTAGGGAIRTLAASLGVRKVHLGHDGRAGFNLDWYSDLVAESGFVVPRLEGPRDICGALHAKVYQVQTSDGLLTMTGSVNATTRSLHGVRNVEVAVARWEKASAFRWTPQQPNTFEPTEFPEGEDAGLLVEAAIEGRAFVCGLVVLPAGLQRPASLQWQLLEAEQQLAEGQAPVDGRGHFRFEILPERSKRPVSLNLVVRIGQLIGYAWLNDEEALYNVGLSGMLDPRLRRAADGLIDVDSALYIRQLLNVALGKQPPAKAKAKKAGAGAAQAPKPDTDEANVPFSYEEWLTSGTSSAQRAGGMVMAPKLLQAVYALLFPPPEGPSDPGPEDVQRSKLLGNTDEEEEQTLGSLPTGNGRKKKRADEGSQAKARRVFEDEVKQACVDIHTAFDAADARMIDTWTLAIVASAMELRKCVNHWQTWRKAHASLSTVPWDFQYGCVLWLERMCRFPFPEHVRDRILPVASALASVAAYQFPSGGASFSPRLEKLPTVKSFLRRLAGRDLNPGEVESLAATGLKDAMFGIVDGQLYEKAVAASIALDAAPYLDDALLNILRSAMEGTPDECGLEASYPAIRLFQGRPRPASAALAVVQPREVEHGCALCHIAFTPQERDELKFQRAVRHRNKGGDTAHLLLYPSDYCSFKTALEDLING